MTIAPANGIRGLACLIVLVVHTAAFNFPQTYPYLQGCGKVGVWLFFALSAYLLTHQLRTRGLSRLSLTDYFVGRTLRIYPLYALAVLGYFVYGGVGIETMRDVWLALSFQKGYAHLWTIPVEFKFYFVLPVILWAAMRVQARLGDRGLLLVATLATLAHQLVAPYWSVTAGTIETFPYLPAFLFGSVAAFFRVRGSDAVGWLILAGMVLAVPGTRHALFGSDLTADLVDKFVYLSLAWTVFIVTQAHSGGALARILSGRFLSRMGDYSYSIYLAHLFVILALTKVFPQSLAACAAAVVLSILAGWGLYTALERPLLSSRKWVMAKLSARSRERLLRRAEIV